MKLSEKLKKLRIKKNITQNQLAKEIYVSRSIIAKYEWITYTFYWNIRKNCKFL